MPSVRVGILLKRVAELGAFSSLPVLKEEMGIVLDRFSEVYIILEMHQQVPDMFVHFISFHHFCK